MTERIADPQAVCPFVAFDDERDFRAPVPDHRHRCFAESPAAPRALAHQAAYCLSGAFPGCPTFVDWARREAAPVKPKSPVRSLRDPAGTPRPAALPSPASQAAEPAPRAGAADWTAPPPWAGPVAGVAVGLGAAGTGSGPEDGLNGPSAAPGADLAGGDLPPGIAPGTAPPAVTATAADDTPAFLAGRSGRSMPPPPVGVPGDDAGVEPYDPAGDPVAAGSGSAVVPASGAPPPRPPGEPRRVPVGYAPVAATKGQRAGTSRPEHADPSAPSWEQPRRLEAYPTLKSRGGGGIPRVAVYAIVVLLAGGVLFAMPFLLRAVGGGGTTSPTAQPSASAQATPKPSATAAASPAQVVYVVKAGDTLSRIAAKYHVTMDQILTANPSIKSADKIAIGDRIVIPQPAASGVVNGAITPAP